MLKSTLKRLIPEKSRLNLRFFWFGLRHQWLKGEERYCNICDKGSKAFGPHTGRFARQDVVCPRCSSLERQRLLMHYLEEKSLLKSSPRLLHIAPEWGFQKKLKGLLGTNYRSADLFSPLAMDKEDLQEMTYADDSFELIIVSHVMSHIEDDKKAFLELSRILSPNGVLILFDRIDKNQPQSKENPEAKSKTEKLAYFGQDDLARIYGQDFFDRLKSAGFLVETSNHAETIDKTLAEKMAINSKEEFYLCKMRS